MTAVIGSITSDALDVTLTAVPPRLTTLTLSGSPSLTYSANLTYDLGGSTLAGTDQFRTAFSTAGLPVTWSMPYEPATVSGTTLTTDGSGPVVVNVAIGTVSSNNLTLRSTGPEHMKIHLPAFQPPPVTQARGTSNALPPGSMIRHLGGFCVPAACTRPHGPTITPVQDKLSAANQFMPWLCRNRTHYLAASLCRPRQ